MCAQSVTDATHGQRYPLCGPKVYTLRQLVAYAGELYRGYRRPISSRAQGPALSKLQASVLERLHPGKLMSRDNLASMQRDSVCDCPFPPLLERASRSRSRRSLPTYIAAGRRQARYGRIRSHRGA